MNRFRTWMGLAIALMLSAAPAFAQDGGGAAAPLPPTPAGRYNVDRPGQCVITYDGLNGIVVNRLVGAERFYNVGVWGQATVTANIEAGHIWNGHETTPRVQDLYTSPGALGETDRHATWVGSVLGGFNPNADPNEYPYHQLGMAPFTRLCSGAIATGWYNALDPDTGGQNVYFDITPKTFYLAYNHFFTTTWTRTLDFGAFSMDFDAPTDVINSSWGYDDPRGTDPFTMASDGFARAHPQTAFVVAAGNSNTPSHPTNNVGGPASGYNTIAVGAVGDYTYDNFTTVADFSSRGPQDYYDPVHHTVPGVRAAVSLVAPGTSLLSAFYGGQTGGNRTSLEGSQPDPSGGAPDWYSWRLAGTSFSAPIVAGGVSLLKTASYILWLGPESRDTRVIKAVLLNSATKLPGWDNGQHANQAGVVVTTQSLDWAQGAGMLDLDRAFTQYLSGTYDPNLVGTADVPGTGGGTILIRGWDYGSIVMDPNLQNISHNDYPISQRLAAGTVMDVTLAWFRNLGVPEFIDNADPNLQSLTTSDLGFANLDLEIWSADFSRRYATSMSQYNDVEHLHVVLPDDGLYGIRVRYTGQVFGTPVAEVYGLAWAAPEPSTWVMLLSMAGTAMAVLIRRRRRARPQDR